MRLLKTMYINRMIPFDEIDKRLDSLGLGRTWLAEATGRSPNSIRVALAPNAASSNRSALLQRSLTEAIIKEEDGRNRHIIINLEEGDKKTLTEAANKSGYTLPDYIYKAAFDALDKSVEDNGGKMILPLEIK